MKRIFCLLIVLLLVSCGSDNIVSLSSDTTKEVSTSNSTISVQSTLSNIEKGKYREGELLVKFKSGVTTTSSLKTHQSIGATSLKKFSIVPNLEHVKLPEGLSGNAGLNDDLSSTGDYPAKYNLPNIIAVAATDESDNLAFFSNFGPNTVHVAAQGVNILSTVPVAGVAADFASACTSSADSKYYFCSGTSMSTPLVSGLAGLIYVLAQGFTLSQVLSAILDDVDVLPTLNRLIFDQWKD